MNDQVCSPILQINASIPWENLTVFNKALQENNLKFKHECMGRESEKKN